MTTDQPGAALLSLEDVDQLPAAALPAFVLALTALQARAAARLMVPVAAQPTITPERDAIEDVDEVARLVRRSVSWVRKRGRELPGFRQPGGRGTRVAWSRRALETWAAGGTC